MCQVNFGFFRPLRSICNSELSIALGEPVSGKKPLEVWGSIYISSPVNIKVRIASLPQVSAGIYILPTRIIIWMTYQGRRLPILKEIHACAITQIDYISHVSNRRCRIWLIRWLTYPHAISSELVYYAFNVLVSVRANFKSLLSLLIRLPTFSIIVLILGTQLLFRTGIRRRDSGLVANVTLRR